MSATSQESVLAAITPHAEHEVFVCVSMLAASLYNLIATPEPMAADLRAVHALQGIFDDIPGITEELYDALSELRAWAAYFAADK